MQSNPPPPLICRLIRKKPKKDLKDYNHRRKVRAAQRKQSLEKCRKKLLLKYLTVVTQKCEDDDGSRTEHMYRKFYMLLSASHSTIRYLKFSLQALPMLISEVEDANFQTKVGKSPGSNGINTELVKWIKTNFWKVFIERFGRNLIDNTVLSSPKSRKPSN